MRYCPGVRLCCILFFFSVFLSMLTPSFLVFTQPPPCEEQQSKSTELDRHSMLNREIPEDSWPKPPVLLVVQYILQQAIPGTCCDC
ncbi:hypothetical protein EDB82DRAFT_490667 [Fusarium venenatum]|uniref:uncharacterized protein n=1 Tax=Fusarium venenatum TaxID=56646 RepID=UPI001D812AA1|nr:hypothetical protein EDB82DRAFT_490667 [Fusarium venenatum]